MKYYVKVTQTNGNSTNKIAGCRIRVRVMRKDSPRDVVVWEDEMVVPAFGGLHYIQQHPKGRYAAMYTTMLDQAWLIAQSRNKQDANKQAETNDGGDGC